MYEPNPTPFDLKFRLFWTPVRVHPGFWFMALLLGWQNFEDGVGFFFLWVGCLFLSMLFHEFGHVIMCRLCGRPAKVVLHSLGGTTVRETAVSQRWPRVLIALAGPAASILLYGLVVWAADHLLPLIPLQFRIQNPTFTQVIVKGTALLLKINLLWSTANLIPIVPLDGGEVTQEIFSVASPRHGVQLALYLSLFLTLAAAGYCFYAFSQKIRLPYELDGIFTGIFLVMLSFTSVQMLMQERKRQREEDAANQDLESHAEWK